LDSSLGLGLPQQAAGNKKMNQKLSSVKVAVVQATPALFDREATAQKARLVVFPEAFIPAYPRGLSFGMVVGGRILEGRRTWQMVWESAVEIPGAATEALGEAPPSPFTPYC
jgi:nitrilase